MSDSISAAVHSLVGAVIVKGGFVCHPPPSVSPTSAGIVHCAAIVMSLPIAAVQPSIW